MRRWLLILLLTLLPLQFSWAEAASYCRHEGSGPSQHFGHHEHQHADGGSDAVQAEGSTGLDLDCGACHAGCAIAILGSAASSASPLLGTARPALQLHPATLPPSLPDRPNWARPA